MTYTPEQPAAVLPLEHPAALYYPVPPEAPDPPEDLTGMGVVAFTTAAVVTLLVCGNALVVGRVMELGGASNVDTVDWSTGIYYLTSLMTYVALVAAWVTGAMWLHRARLNAVALNPGARHVRRAGWAWAGWIVPVVGFWFPYQLVRDVDAAVAPRTPTRGLVGLWWATWLLTVIGWRVSESIRNNAIDNGTSPFTVQAVAVMVAVVTLVALTMWGMVLQRVTAEQHAVMYGARPLDQASPKTA